MGKVAHQYYPLLHAHCYRRITSGYPKLAQWRLLFIVEGLPTLCMAPVAYFFLPDTPDKARFLTEEEKVGEGFMHMIAIETHTMKLIAKARGVRQVGSVERVGGIVWKDVGLALLDLKCWFTAVSEIFAFFGLRGAMAPLMLFALVQRADLVQFMYFSCNVGFSSLPGIYLYRISFILKIAHPRSFLTNDFKRYGVQ